MIRRLSTSNNYQNENGIMEETSIAQTMLKQNCIAFWLLGLCNNFLYVVVLSGAKDILETGSESQIQTNITCREKIDSRSCHVISTSAVLLADIIPALIVKISAPFYIHLLPFELRHITVVLLQIFGLLIVALSSSVILSLTGVVIGSFGSGLGEITYLALASHYDVEIITYFSSGTGGAGIIGSLAYALLTEKIFSPKNALLFMLVIPCIFFSTFFFLLTLPPSIHRLQLCNLHSYLVQSRSQPFRLDREARRSSDDEEPLLSLEDPDIIVHQSNESFTSWSLLRYAVPLTAVYFFEYEINQGVTELLEFNCQNGFRLSAASQYRWYKFRFKADRLQFGVFLSRSSTKLFTIKSEFLPLLAILQCFNATLLIVDSIEYFIPNIALVFLIIFYEGILGGLSYANTFNNLHFEIPFEKREFSMAVVSISDSLGIFAAGLTAIPLHNWICSKPL